MAIAANDDAGVAAAQSPWTVAGGVEAALKVIEDALRARPDMRVTGVCWGFCFEVWGCVNVSEVAYGSVRSWHCCCSAVHVCTLSAGLGPCTAVP
jgi:hypothetical protein